MNFTTRFEFVRIWLSIVFNRGFSDCRDAVVIENKTSAKLAKRTITMVGWNPRGLKMARFDMGNIEFAGAGDSNNADAMFELGLVYATGRDGDMDVVSAHKWFNLAAYGGNEMAKVRREELAAEMSKEQIAEAQKAAREWVTSH